MTQKLLHLWCHSQKIHNSQPKKFFPLQTRRLSDPFEPLNSSLAQSAEELWRWHSNWKLLVLGWIPGTTYSSNSSQSVKHCMLFQQDIPVTTNQVNQQKRNARIVELHIHQEIGWWQTCLCWRMVGSPVYLNIVPVRVFSGGNFRYAFLNQHSTMALCHWRVLDKLGMSGQEAKFSLTTINKDLVNRHGLVQLSMAPLDGSDVIELPCVFSVEHLAVSQNPSFCYKDSVGLICVVLHLWCFLTHKSVTADWGRCTRGILDINRVQG